MKSWDGMVYWYPENYRNPAAINRVFDFSHLEGSALMMASQKRLLEDARVVETEDQVGIELGHFVVKDSRDNRKFACDVYNKLELRFESADMSVSGDPSVMYIEADCNADKNTNKIQTLWIPMQKILQEKEGDIELQFPNQSKAHFKFQNIGDRWPRAWTLTKIRMYNEFEVSVSLEMDHEQMKKISDRPVTLIWDKDL
jgi:hypothetical protein